MKTPDEADWSMLSSHAQRDALILVSHEVRLLEAAAAMERNDSQLIQDWIDHGRLRKPTASELARWNADPGKKFVIFVVAPFVLAQEMLVH